MTRTIEDILADVESLPSGNLPHDENMIIELMVETLKLCCAYFNEEDRSDDLHFLVDAVIQKESKISDIWYD